MRNPLTHPDRARFALGGLIGFLAGLAGVAVSEAASRLLTGVTSPLLAVGNRAIDLTPRPVKEWAIENFGTNDKPVLIGGVVATVAGLAIVIGAVGVKSRRLAVGLFGALVLVASVAAVADRAATAGPVLRLVPVLALAVVGLGSLLWLLGTLGLPRSTTGPATAAPAAPARRASTTPLTSAREGAVATEDGGKARLQLPTHVEVPLAFDRRKFLQAALAVSAVAAAGITARQLSGTSAVGSRAAVRLPSAATSTPLPNGVNLPVQGITPYLTSNQEFYRVDTALSVPQVPIDGYTLRIHGLVDREIELTFADLLKRRLVEKRITLTCVSNPVGGEYVGNAAWLGVMVKDLLAEAGVQGDADAVKTTSADGMTIGTPLAALTDDRGAMIAVGMNGEPLPLEHGFPVRMVVPGLYGYVSATKWLIDIEVTRFADFKAYWTTRGYAEEAPIKTSARIDVPRSFAKLSAGKNAVAGVAWSQNSGIEKVEVSVDDGPWQTARLAKEDGIETWRQWVLDWDAQPGSHTLKVRATDKSGYTQTSDRAPIAPNGSTGWDSVAITVQ